MVRLLRRFLVLLMKRIVGFCHAQQLTVPMVFFVCFEAWRVATGRLTWASFQRNPWDEFYPYLATFGVLLIPQIGLAARDLHRELLLEARAHAPKIIHSENVIKEPSRAPAILIACVFIASVLVFELLAVEHAFPMDFMSVSQPASPKPPEIAFIRSIHNPPKPPRLHVVRHATMPYEIGKTLKVRMFVDNLGDSALIANGGTYVSLHDVPSAYDERAKLEQSLWSTMESLPEHPERHTEIPVMPQGSFFIEIESDHNLTQPEIDKLTGGGAMYLITFYKDSTGLMRIGSCIRTVSSRDSVLYCLNPSHNFDDVNKRSRKPSAKEAN
jgi:hypothetical protein